MANPVEKENMEKALVNMLVAYWKPYEAILANKMFYES